MSEQCFVCGTATDLSCAGCDLLYYCGVDCQRADRHYHIAECERGTIGAFWGIGKWRSIVDEHAELLMRSAREIITPDEDEPMRLTTTLETNLARWSKGDTSDTQTLRQRVHRFNTKYDTLAKAYQTNAEANINESKRLLKEAAFQLASFFRDRLNFGTVWSSREDYKIAFDIYADRLDNYARSLALLIRADLSQRRDYDALLIANRDEVLRAAGKLAAVLNGRPWR